VCGFIRGTVEAQPLLERLPEATSPGFDPERDLQRIGLANQTTMLMTESLEIQENPGRDARALGRSRARQVPRRVPGRILVLSGDRHYEEFGIASLPITGSGQGWAPDIFLPESQAMSRSSTWKTPRRRSGGKAASIVFSFSVGSARR